VCVREIGWVKYGTECVREIGRGKTDRNSPRVRSYGSLTRPWCRYAKCKAKPQIGHSESKCDRNREWVCGSKVLDCNAHHLSSCIFVVVNNQGEAQRITRVAHADRGLIYHKLHDCGSS
jgi:hypothetical protein